MIPFSKSSIRLNLALITVIGLFNGCSAPVRISESLAKKTLSADTETVRLDEKQKTEIQMGLARSFEVREDFDRAEKIYREILSDQTKNVSAIHRLAIVCDCQRRFDESESLYRKAIDLAPDNAFIRGDYGYSLYRQRRWDEAEKTLRHALEIDPRDRRSHNHLGLLLAQTGRTRAAMAEFLEAGCSEEEARSNVETVRQLNGMTKLSAERPERSATDEHGDPSSDTSASRNTTISVQREPVGAASVQLESLD